ncbi:MAG TPA: MarR family transcriptional regulator [Chitinophagales bacterium]|nr:MarR family transcriptional regulator [Chitinophagales bacterium]
MFKVNESMGFLVGSLAKRSAARFMQLMQQEGIDIGLSGWIVLSRLWEEDGLTQQDISDRSGVAKPNISTYIDNLEKANYVVRVDDATDRRNYRIQMTQKAKNLKDKCQSLAQQSNNEAMENLSEPEREQFLKLLRKMNR